MCMQIFTKILQIIFNPSVWVSKLLLLLFVLGFLALVFFDYLDPIEKYINGIAGTFKLGDIEFTLYGMIRTIIVILILLWAAGIACDWIEQLLKKNKNFRADNKALISKLTQIFIYFLACTFALNILGINLTNFALLGGAIGIGLGFGLQKITSNFISGMILIFEKTIKNNDLVELQDGTYGIIKKIAARYTLLESFDGKEIMIPNEDFITSKVVNWTYTHSKARVKIDIGVAYGSDLDLVQKLLIKCAKSCKRCVEDPEPHCYMRDFGSSSIDFLLVFWVNDVKEGRFQPKSEVLNKIWKEFQKHSITIPFPQSDIHIIDNKFKKK